MATNTKIGDVVSVLFFDNRTGREWSESLKITSAPVPDIDRTLVAQVEGCRNVVWSAGNINRWVYSPLHEYC